MVENPRTGRNNGPVGDNHQSNKKKMGQIDVDNFQPIVDKSSFTRPGDDLEAGRRLSNVES